MSKRRAVKHLEDCHQRAILERTDGRPVREISRNLKEAFPGEWIPPEVIGRFLKERRQSENRSRAGNRNSYYLRPSRARLIS